MMPTVDIPLSAIPHTTGSFFAAASQEDRYATHYSLLGYGDEGEVCTTDIERSVAKQHERPSGVDLTPDGKQLPDRCNGSEEPILATVHLVTKKLWDAYLDVPSALSTGLDKGFVRTSCCVEVVSRVDGTPLRRKSREILSCSASKPSN
jgi:hypothetical protein